MRKALVVGLVAVVTVLAVAGCNKKNPEGDMAPAASADPGASTLTDIKYTAKPPARGKRPSTEKAFKGGSGGTVPTVVSRKLNEASTDRQVRKHAKADMADCKTLPDNAAECDGNSLYFCDDQKLWVVDCEAEAKLGGATGGSCFEGEKFIDCLGQIKADDNSDVWCDFQTTVCCDKDGTCYSPK